MSICAPAWVPLPKLSCTAPLLICGANPKCTPRFRPASLPVAENVANAGSSPVRTLEFAGPLLLTFENTQKAFTFPENENDHPLDICIVRPCALAVAETPRAKPNNNSVRRFIRDSLLGSLRAAILPLVPSRRLSNCPRQVQPSGKVLPPVTRLASHLQLCGTDTANRSPPPCERVSCEARVSPQEWPLMTAWQLSPKPRDEPTYRPPHGPEPRKILGRTPPYPQ